MTIEIIIIVLILLPFREVDFRLSLNGKNPLQEDGRTRLCDIGIVTGDLVHILIDSNSSR